MASARFEQLLAGTAVALALALTPYASSAFAAVRGGDCRRRADARERRPAAAEHQGRCPGRCGDEARTPAAAGEPRSGEARSRRAAETTNSVPRDRRRQVQHRVGPADTAIVDKLRDQLASGKFDRILGGKKERVTVEAFYASRDFAPLWIADGAITERAKAAAAYLARRRCRRPRSERLSGPADQGRHRAGGAGRGRDQVHRRGADLRAPRHGRPRALQPRRRRHRLRSGQARSGQCAGPASPRRRTPAPRSTASTRRSRSYKALKAKLAEMRNGADDVAKPMIAQGPVLKYSKDKKGKEVLMEDPRVPALRERFGLKSPRRRHHLRQGAVRHDRQVPEGKRHQRQRPAQRRDARRHQRPQAREDGRHHHRQHGALALDAARPRQDLRDGQHPGLHAAGRARRQARLEDQGRGRQAEPADAAASARR